MENQQLKQEIFETIKTVGRMDYVQLVRILMTKGLDPTGSYNIGIHEKNALFWTGLNKQVVDVIVELLNEKKLINLPYPLEVYKLDGFKSEIPVSSEIPTEGLKTLTFVPTCLGIASQA